MAIMYKGNKLANLSLNGHAIDTMWYKGKKIYSSYLPIGYVLWKGPNAFSGPFSEIQEKGTIGGNNFVLMGQTVKFNQPLKKG